MHTRRAVKRLRSRYCTVESNYREGEATHDLSATAELLVLSRMSTIKQPDDGIVLCTGCCGCVAIVHPS